MCFLLVVACKASLLKIQHSDWKVMEAVDTPGETSSPAKQQDDTVEALSKKNGL